MKLPRLDMGSALGPAVERMLYEGRERRPQPLSRRELESEAAATALLLAAVLAIALLFDDQRSFHIGRAAAFTLAFALAARVRFSIGPGYTTPVQLIFFPMLFFL